MLVCTLQGQTETMYFCDMIAIHFVASSEPVFRGLVFQVLKNLHPILGTHLVE